MVGPDLPPGDLRGLLRLATVLLGSPTGAVTLVADSLTRSLPRVNLVDGAEAIPLRDLVRTFLAAGRPSPSESTSEGLHQLPRVQSTVVALHDYQLLDLETTARLTNLDPVTVALELAAAHNLVGEREQLAPALHRLALTAPSWHLLPTELHRRHSRKRRLRFAIGIAAAVILLGLGTPLMIMPRLPQKAYQPANQSFSHIVDPPRGYQVESRTLSTQAEATTLINTANPEQIPCTVQLFVAQDMRGMGEFDPTGSETESATVNGRPGVFRPAQQRQDNHNLLWRYADHAWASVSCPRTISAPRKELMRLARSVRFVQSPLKIPVVLRRLPEGYTPWVMHAAQHEPSANVILKPPSRDGWQLSISVDTLPPLPASSTSEKIMVNGRAARFDQGLHTLCWSDRGSYLCITAIRTQRTDTPPDMMHDLRPLLVKVAEQLETCPDIADRGTWFDARVAVP